MRTGAHVKPLTHALRRLRRGHRPPGATPVTDGTAAAFNGGSAYAIVNVAGPIANGLYADADTFAVGSQTIAPDKSSNTIAATMPVRRVARRALKLLRLRPAHPPLETTR